MNELESTVHRELIPRLSVDLKNELPEEKGVSPANHKRMVKFWGECPELSQMGAPPVRQNTSDVTSQIGATESHLLSWSHFVELLKIDDPLERFFSVVSNYFLLVVSYAIG
jgi:hypothetical protein